MDIDILEQERHSIYDLEVKGRNVISPDICKAFIFLYLWCIDTYVSWV